MAKLDRLMTLLRALAEDADGLSLDEMARRLETSRRTAERLRDIVATHFELEEIPDGRIKRFRLAAGGLGRLMTAPTAVELSALAAQAEALRIAGEPSRAALLDSLLEQIRIAQDGRNRRRTGPDLEVLRRSERVRVQAGPAVRVDPSTLAAAQDAILSGSMLEFNYSTGGGKRRSRRACPYGILHGPVTYLVAALPGRENEPALFRLDRMSKTAVSDVPAVIPDSFDLEAYAARSFGSFQEPPEDIVLRFSGGSAAIARGWRFHPYQSIEEQADGSLVVRFRAGGLFELAEHLFIWGNEVEILEPPTLRSLMIDKLRESLAWHVANPTTGNVVADR